MAVLSDLVPTVQPEVAAICLLGTLWRQPKKLQHAMPDSVSQLQSYFSCVIGNLSCSPICHENTPILGFPPALDLDGAVMLR